MIKITSLTTIAGALLACGLSAVPAHALANRTFVSGKGTDAGACTVTAPCQTFAFAITQTDAGGEIDVVDTGDYGPVTITKSISIVNDGAGVAGIQTVPFVDGVTINAGANDSVHLRGLTIDGLGVGSHGILFFTGKSLAIENCVIRNFESAGIDFSASTSSNFSVLNTIASNNFDGIAIEPTGAPVVKGVLSKVTTNNNKFAGIAVVGSLMTGGVTLRVTLVDSEASHNAKGVEVVGRGDGGVILVLAVVMARNFVASCNDVGLDAAQIGSLVVAHSVVTGNGTGLASSDGGILSSYGDNNIIGNITNVSGTLRPVAPR